MTVARSIPEERRDQLKKNFVCHFVELVYFHLQSVKHLIFEETVLAPWLKALKKEHLVIQLLSHVQLFAIPCTAAYQASLSLTISWNLLSSYPLSW